MNSNMNDFYKSEKKKGKIKELVNTVTFETARETEAIISIFADLGYDVEYRMIPVGEYNSKLEIKLYRTR